MRRELNAENSVPRPFGSRGSLGFVLLRLSTRKKEVVRLPSCGVRCVARARTRDMLNNSSPAKDSRSYIDAALDLAGKLRGPLVRRGIVVRLRERGKIDFVGSIVVNVEQLRDGADHAGNIGVGVFTIDDEWFDAVGFEPSPPVEPLSFEPA